MSEAQDRTKRHIGEVYGRLVIVAVGELSKSGRMYECLCACGNRKSVLYQNLRAGAIRSCGCLKRITSAVNARKKVMK